MKMEWNKEKKNKNRVKKNLQVIRKIGGKED